MSDARKILLNGLQVDNETTGVQYYTKNLYKELVKFDSIEYVFHLLVRSKNTKPFHATASGLTDVCTRNYRRNRLKRILNENLSLPGYLRSNAYALYHSPNYVLPFHIKTPTVLTVHDLIALDYPELCQTESALYFKLFLGRSIQKASKIIAVSNTVKNDIKRHFPFAEKKTVTVYHGLSSAFKQRADIQTLRKYQIPDLFILFTGNIEPKKNLERLIRAFDALKRKSDIRHKLVLTGKKGWKYTRVYKTIAELKIGDEIIFTGYVPENDLAVLYSMADIFVFPSLYEGFGFPPLEAMACETPVLASDKGSLPEVSGSNCLQINPYNTSQITEGMYTLITNKALREKLIIQGKEWIKQFTWKRSAKETIRVYQDTLCR